MMLRRAGFVLAVAVAMLLIVAAVVVCDGPGREQTSVVCETQGCTCPRCIVDVELTSAVAIDIGATYAELASEERDGAASEAQANIVNRSNTPQSERRACVWPRHGGLKRVDASGLETWNGGREGAGVRAGA